MTFLNSKNHAGWACLSYKLDVGLVISLTNSYQISHNHVQTTTLDHYRVSKTTNILFTIACSAPCLDLD